MKLKSLHEDADQLSLVRYINSIIKTIDAVPIKLKAQELLDQAIRSQDFIEILRFLNKINKYGKSTN